MLIQIENTRLILFLFLNEQSGCTYFILTVFLTDLYFLMIDEIAVILLIIFLADLYLSLLCLDFFFTMRHINLFNSSCIYLTGG